jgi:hypothetical protein
LFYLDASNIRALGLAAEFFFPNRASLVGLG